ncbi:hypothetical protein FNV43_RR16198 [Rhamnella rubrinervis]|uniref:VQ domain-containing protein n=1 Tax=Rhamnella rubrinervis TaxID=2594499 RepID=A0A8K0EDP6_9ROSA|nr:hypothetical protein FNV43_RR16198 [Rhamnella rubrinervis]
MSSGRVGDGGDVGREAQPKVVIINTQYVETDAVSFKSVVQRLTGKDSTEDHPQVPIRSTSTEKLKGGGGRQAAPVLTRVVSFKDFDTLLKDMPSIDDLCNVTDSFID